MNLDWRAIRPLNGSQAAGFEELCAQLARAEIPAGAKFERKGTPDAGVECFGVLSDGSEWGWQAKYFTTLGDSQFAQLDGSVKTALSRHSSLTRYFVCVPLDRPDARVDGNKSAMERWTERVSKWERWARESGRHVDFVWWGSSELLERLARTEHVGRVFFWFGQRGFDQSWFDARLREALDSAGPRYTPPVHVDLPIAKVLECFGRTGSSIEAVKAQAIPLWKALQTLNTAVRDENPLAASPWIAVLLSVRSTYADVIVPEEVHRKAAAAVHHGFVDHEYNAARIFFSHYELELPSTPIIQPEFRNPLFLKTICQGLRDDGQRRLPRGLHGISAAFKLYLRTINRRLAADLGYNPHDEIVRKALRSLAQLVLTHGKRWLPRAGASALVDELLPGREYERSLYRGLVSEGLLVEDMPRFNRDDDEEIVFISYERHADHAIADLLLSTHLDAESPGSAFAEGGGLAFLCDSPSHMSRGLIEALCIQIPESTGTELFALAPALAGRPGAAVHWASDITPNTKLGDRADELCSVVPAWMLTTSNRFLRDRATKSLVSLLTGRLTTARLLLERFAEVDDAYVAERVHAAVYGVVMRSRDRREVGAIASTVYKLVFADGAPPAHVLLRDYARGIIERALYLGADIDIDPALIRPPYTSTWPAIPNEAELEPYLTDRSAGTYYISRSVMNGDFALYVIGTNSSSTNWQSLRLNEPPWCSSDVRMENLLPTLDDVSQEAWKRCKEAEGALNRRRFLQGLVQETSRNTDAPAEAIGDDDQVRPSSEDLPPVSRAKAALLEARERFRDGLSTDQKREVDSILTQRRAGEREYPPRFDLKWIQRYVLRRVFELGWTAERFGDFEKFDLERPVFRDAAKPERIGKKYQWIAYHEILAHIADHYQYREHYREEEGDQSYQGPWQEFLRDIDPSVMFSSKPGGTGWGSHEPAWWARERYTAWAAGSSARDWMICEADIPNVASLLASCDSRSGTDWLNLHGCPVTVRPATLWCWCRPSGFDCSLEEDCALQVPHWDLLERLELNWTGRGADFVDRESNLAVFDPTAHEDGPTALLARDDLVRRYLNESDMALCWTVLGEKRIIGREANRNYQGTLHISGAYTLRDDGPDGFLKFRRDRLDQRDETGLPDAADSASTFQDAGTSPDSSDTPAREATPGGSAEAEGAEP